MLVLRILVIFAFGKFVNLKAAAWNLEKKKVRKTSGWVVGVVVERGGLKLMEIG